MSDLKAEVQSAFNAIDEKVGKALEKHDSEFLELGKASKKSSEELKALTEEHASLHKQLQGFGDSLTAIEQKQTGHKAEEKSAQGIGTQFVGSDAFKDFMGGQTTRASHEFQGNTIVTGGDNSVTRHEQLPGVVPGAVRQLTVMPTVMQGQATSNIIYYSKELLWTNSAAPTAEGTQKPESVLTFEEVNKPMITVPHFIKVSKQALDDSTFLASYVDGRMAHGVNNKIEQQVIAGTGLTGNMSGWLATGNHTVVSPLLTIDIYGLANKLKYAVIAADYMPDYFYMNPADWSKAELLRRGSADAAFIAGSGAVNYINNGLTPLLWGLPVVLSNNVPVGTMICKSSMADQYFSRNSVRVEMFEQDVNNVQLNLVTVRAEARGAEAVYTPAAIVTGDITGITSPT